MQNRANRKYWRKLCTSLPKYDIIPTPLTQRLAHTMSIYIMSFVHRSKNIVCVEIRVLCAKKKINRKCCWRNKAGPTDMFTGLLRSACTWKVYASPRRFDLNHFQKYVRARAQTRCLTNAQARLQMFLSSFLISRVGLHYIYGSMQYDYK